MYRRFGKRFFDVVISGAAIVLLSPLLAAIAAAIRLRLGKPALFRQRRPGRGGRLFTVLKFRTMIEPAPGQNACATDGERLTAFGAFLRRSSLDELPELFNVFRGDMSLVGPRPLLAEYLTRYNPDQQRRHEVASGITGWAQVNGRNAISWERKFELDVWYVDHLSFGLDLRILAMTLARVVRRDDISADGYATVPRFMGSR